MFSTFPLRAIVDGACNCSEGAKCKTIGKHPACDWKTSSEPFPHVTIGGHGIRTGTPSGIWVLDVDFRPEKGVDGFKSLAELGVLPTTYHVKSPTGGTHYYFSLPADGTVIRNSVGKLGPGLDVRGEGGMVVGPGSPHKKGGIYCLFEDDQDIIAAPDWLLEAVKKLGVAKPTPVGTKILPMAKDHKEYPRRLELAREHCMTADPAIQGSDGSGRTMSVAHHLTVKLELSVDVAYGLMREHFNPRCEPEWDDKLLYKKVYDAAQNGVEASPGIAPENWELKGPPRTQPIEEMPLYGRRVHDPNHRYSFVVGQSGNGKCYKVALGEVISDLTQLEEWQGVFQYDEFGDKIIAVDPPVKLEAESKRLSDNDINVVRCWFEVVAGKLVSKDMMYDAILSVAFGMAFHPVKDYLESLPVIEEKEYLDVFTRYVFGNVEPIQVEFIKKALVGAVKRIYEPGCFVKSILILYGSQNAGKSSFCKKLFGQWFKEGISDLKSKDALQELLGVWGLEMSEMDSISRAEIKTVKSFISTACDKYRPSYGRCSVERPRQNIFIGTTNEDDFLRDATGGTRFWPVQVPEDMPTDWDRDEVWSAAYQLYLSGYSCYLDTTEQTKTADEIREANTYQDPWTQHVEKVLMGKKLVSAQQVAMILLPEVEQLDGRAMARVQSTLKIICGKAIQIGRSNRTRWYQVPERFQKQTPPTSPDDKNKPS